MPRYFLIPLLFFCTSLLFSQPKEKHANTKKYVSLASWRLVYGEPLTKKDSLNFVYVNNDTLVLLRPDVIPKGRHVPYEYKDSTFLSYYKKIAFRLKNDSTDKKQVMRYWKKPIKVFFGKSVSNNAKKELKDFAKSTVNLIDSLKIEFVNTVEESNYIIYYSEDYNYESKINTRSKSEYYMHWNGGKITKFAMRIDSNHYFSDKLRVMEMKRYFIESLGYFKTLEDFECDSYFSSCHSKEKKLTSLDIEILKYHYSYGICKGTNLETFENQHKRARELLKENPKNKMNFYHPYE